MGEVCRVVALLVSMFAFTLLAFIGFLSHSYYVTFIFCVAVGYSSYFKFILKFIIYVMIFTWFLVF